MKDYSHYFEYTVYDENDSTFTVIFNEYERIIVDTITSHFDISVEGIMNFAVKNASGILSGESIKNIRANQNKEKKSDDSEKQTYQYDKSKVKDESKAIVGYFLLEMWTECKGELCNLDNECELDDIFHALDRGIEKGLRNGTNKYKKTIEDAKEGNTSEECRNIILAFKDIFAHMSKNKVKILKGMYVPAVDAGEVLFFNPENYYLGERLKVATITIMLGATALAGEFVGDFIAQSGLDINGQLSDCMEIIVESMLACTLLIFIDRSKFINNVVSKMDEIPSEANNYREIADKFEELSAKMAELDIDKFKKQARDFMFAAIRVASCNSEDELNELLKQFMEEFGVDIPWKGSFDDFMGNSANSLIFS